MVFRNFLNTIFCIINFLGSIAKICAVAPTATQPKRAQPKLPQDNVLLSHSPNVFARNLLEITCPTATQRKRVQPKLPQVLLSQSQKRVRPNLPQANDLRLRQQVAVRRRNR